MAKGLGDVLLEQGVINEAVLAAAVQRREEQGISLGKALVTMGAITEREIVAALARQIKMPFADLQPGSVDPDAAVLLPRLLARELVALPVAFGERNSLTVAVADPGNTTALQRIGEMTRMRVTPALAVRGDLLRAIEHLADEDGSAAATPNAEPVRQRATDDIETDANPGPPLLAFEEDTLVDVNELLLTLIERGGSDLHITAGSPPAIRVNGELEALADHPEMTPNEIQKLIYGFLTQKQREQFENTLELDLSYSVPGRARFRVNVFQQRNSIGAVLRVIPFEIKTVEQLGIPAQISNFAYLPRGFVLVTGPTGSGKSTTLAALIDLINRERACHIMTVEDPIEFLHNHKRSLVNQRELGTDTQSFAAALKHVLRQDPDVILVGEMRDLETIQVALTAAETGHLVFGTLHTQDAPQTVDRIIDVFPPHQQEQIRVMLAGALQGVVCQTLLKTTDGMSRVAATEVMVATPAIRNLVREGKTHQMYSSLQSGRKFGMITMDQSLANLVAAGKVTYDAALERAHDPAEFNRLCGRA